MGKFPPPHTLHIVVEKWKERFAILKEGRKLS